MPDHLSLDQVHHHLRDVGRVVGHPLQEAGDEDHPDGAGDRPGVLHHEGQQLPEDLLLEGVHLGVLPAHLPGQRGVVGHEGVQALLDHALRPLGHAGEVDVGLELGLAVQIDHPLGDVDRLVSDPLQVGDDLHRGGDEAQVAGRGLVQREQAHALLVDLDVVGVDLPVPLDDLLGEGVVALQQRLHDPADLVLDEPAHGEQGLLERLQLLVEVSRHGRVSLAYPKRPVM
jgi:hypothetical protein